VDTGFSCGWCNKRFSSNSHTTRHHLTCNVKYQHELLENKLEDTNQIILAELQELKEKYEMLEHTVSIKAVPTTATTTQGNQNVIATNSNHSNNTTNKHITIHNYGKQSMDHMTVKKIIFVFDKCFRSVCECVKLIHFSPLVPENRNICIKDMKSKYAYIYCDGNWDITGRVQLIDDMYDDICEYIEKKLEELKEEIDEKYIARIKRFLAEKDDAKIVKVVKDDLRMLLFNEYSKTNV